MNVSCEILVKFAWLMVMSLFWLVEASSLSDAENHSDIAVLKSGSGKQKQMEEQEHNENFLHHFPLFAAFLLWFACAFDHSLYKLHGLTVESLAAEIIRDVAHTLFFDKMNGLKFFLLWLFSCSLVALTVLLVICALGFLLMVAAHSGSSAESNTIFSVLLGSSSVAESIHATITADDRSPC